MEDLNGRWCGDVEGTNAGKISIDLVQDGSSLRGEIKILDHKLGAADYRLTGTLEGQKISMSLSPHAAVPGQVIGNVEGYGEVLEDGKIRGRWDSSIGTAGVFTVAHERTLSDSGSKH